MSTQKFPRWNESGGALRNGKKDGWGSTRGRDGHMLFFLLLLVSACVDVGPFAWGLPCFGLWKCGDGTQTVDPLCRNPTIFTGGGGSTRWTSFLDVFLVYCIEGNHLHPILRNTVGNLFTGEERSCPRRLSTPGGRGRSLC